MHDQIFRGFFIPVWTFAIALFICCSQQKSKEVKSIKTPFAREDTTLISQGKSLFRENCGACHAITKWDNMFRGIVDRLGPDYIKLYITKQDSLIKAKNRYAVAIKNDYGNQPNAHNYTFTDHELNAIIAYFQKYSP